MASITYPNASTEALLLAAYLLPISADKIQVNSGSLSVTLPASANEQSDFATGIFEPLMQEASNQTAYAAALGSSKDDTSSILDWVTKSLKQSDEASRKSTSDHLKTQTYLVNNKLSAADVAAYASLHPFISSASHEIRLSLAPLTRFFDLIQNSQLVTSARSKLSTFSPVTIDVDNIPEVERKAEPKKPKKEAAKETASEPAAAAQGEKKPKKEKAPKAEKEKKAPAPAPTAEAPAPWMIDLRVGRIVEVAKHPDADSLYVEKIDIGEEEPRTVVSGLVNYVPIEEMQGRMLVAVCNLKPASMRGVKSFAMVLCASNKGEGGGVEIMDVPEGSVPGDKVYFEGFESEKPLDLLNPKKKIFETVQPGFITLDDKVGAWIDPNDKSSIRRIRTDKGFIKSKSMIGASLS